MEVACGVAVGAAIDAGDAVGTGEAVCVAVGFGAAVAVGAADAVGAGEAEAVRVAVGLGAAVAVVVGLGACVVVAVVPKTNIAEAVAVVGAFLFPPFPLLLPATDEVVAVLEAARTSCVPPADKGTVNVARNDPLPAEFTEGIPAAEPSHVSCTVVRPKFDPEAVT